VAKTYRILHAIFTTAVDDDLIRRSLCRSRVQAKTPPRSSRSPRLTTCSPSPRRSSRAIFRQDGIILPQLYSAGLQHPVNHRHHVYWRFDFDIAGSAQNLAFLRAESWLADDLRKHLNGENTEVEDAQGHPEGGGRRRAVGDVASVDLRLSLPLHRSWSRCRCRRGMVSLLLLPLRGTVVAGSGVEGPLSQICVRGW
jgi:hypothetical protein